MANKHMNKLRSGSGLQLSHHRSSLSPSTASRPAATGGHPPTESHTLSQQGADSSATSLISLCSFKPSLHHPSHHFHGQIGHDEQSYALDQVVQEKHNITRIDSNHEDNGHHHHNIHTIAKFITRSMSFHNSCISDVGDHIFHPILCKPSGHHVKRYEQQYHKPSTHDQSDHPYYAPTHNYHPPLQNLLHNQHTHKHHSSTRNHHIDFTPGHYAHHNHSIRLPPKGHLALYVNDGEERFVVPISYLYHPLFQDLLHRAEDEFGYHQQGGLLLPCSLSEFQHILSCIQSEVQHHHHHVNITTK